MLNEAANLKLIHEQVEVLKYFLIDYFSILNFLKTHFEQKELKKNYLTYKRNTTGDNTNLFETDENQPNADLSNRSNATLDFSNRSRLF